MVCGLWYGISLPNNSGSSGVGALEAGVDSRYLPLPLPLPLYGLVWYGMVWYGMVWYAAATDWNLFLVVCVYVTCSDSDQQLFDFDDQDLNFNLDTMYVLLFLSFFLSLVV